MSSTPLYNVSADAQRRLEEFSEEFRGALALQSDFPLWASELGLVKTTSALKSTFPLPLDAAGYKEMQGDIKFRDLYFRSMSMVGKTWYDGVEADAAQVEAPDFMDWNSAPANMALEWSRLPNQIVADLLALSSLNGPLLSFYDDNDSQTKGTRRWVANDHPYNVLDSNVGTFTNYTTTTVAAIQNGSFFDTCDQYFSGLKGPNGKPLGLRFRNGGRILHAGTRETLFTNVLTQDTLIRAVDSAGKLNQTSGNVAAVTQSNIYKGISSIRADELADQDYFYCFAAPKPGLYSFVVQKEAAPEELVWDKTSELYKRSGKIAFASRGRMNAAFALPHGILRVQITG